MGGSMPVRRPKTARRAPARLNGVSDHRQLDPSEIYHAAVDWSGAYSVTCQGPVDAMLLDRAFAALHARVPLLRGRLERNERGFRFRVASERVPETTVRSGGYEAYLAEMGRPLDSSRELSRLALVRGRDTSYVILSLHHAIADGRAGIALFERVWRNYTALIEGRPLPAGPVEPLPASAETLLVARGWVRDEPSEPIGPAADLAVPPPEVVVPDRVSLDEAETARLFAYCKAEGLSVHGYVCGAALVACRDELRVGDGPLAMMCGCPVDLRYRVTPPVAADEATVFVSGVEFPVVVARGADPVGIGRAAKRTLDTAIASGEAERALFGLRPETAAENRLPDLVVTNVGPVTPFTTPDGLRITDFRGYTSTTIPGLLMFIVTSYGGRLSVDVSTPAGLLTEDQRAGVTARVAEILRPAAVADHGHVGARSAGA
jgi:hypothetical protein